VAFLLQVQETYIEEWHDCYLSESKKTGFVCTLQLANKKHRFYGLNDLNALLKEAKKRKTDVYLSLNAFEYGSRTTKALKQIRNIGVDIDCYKVNVSISKALEEIKQLIIKGKIPNPNLVIFSGRGLQLVYSISGGAAPAMAFLTQYITTQYIAELKHLGADTAATDVTRVFRLPYSINGRNGKQVTVEIWRTLEYSLEELYSYCTPLERRRKPVKRRKGTVSIFTPKRGLKTLYSLNTARKNDLELLVTLRNGDIEKRNVLTYIYAYTVALILKNKQATIDFALQLNDRFQEPQKASEVKRTAGNAYDDAMEFFEEFQKRDFRMWYSLDEIAVKKGHQYETVLMDARAGSVMGMHADRQCDSAINLLSQNILSKEMVQTVILDMWEPYHKAVRALFPSASIVIDKYHVVQKVTQALDQARKEFSPLKKARYLLLKGCEKLRKDQRLRLDDILEEYPALSIAYYLKELFRDFYRIDGYHEAKERLEEWIKLAKQSPFASFQEAANTLERWKEPILSYFLFPYTNARIEGTNHKIKNIKRRAYGYRNLERFRLRVFLECTGNTTGSQAA